MTQDVRSHGQQLRIGESGTEGGALPCQFLILKECEVRVAHSDKVGIGHCFSLALDSRNCSFSG